MHVLSNDLHHTNPVLKLAHLLGKLRVAGLQKRSVSLAGAMLSPRWQAPPIGRFCIRLAVISNSIDYLVLVPFKDADEEFKSIYK